MSALTADEMMDMGAQPSRSYRNTSRITRGGVSVSREYFTPTREPKLEVKPEPDYKGFSQHVKDYKEAGIPMSIDISHRLAKLYNTPIPGTPEWSAEFDAPKNNNPFA